MVLKVFFVLFILFSQIGFATTRPVAPLYWSAYEYCYKASANGMFGGAIPESEWKKNIDWVEKNLKPFGYNMVCIDGWGDDYSFNENGYRTKHASGQGASGSINWSNDYAWWATYLNSKGMSLGMYNNPLWINKKAANCRIKGRTDLTVGSLINEKEKTTWFTWVQVDRPGAEEYVKGYIQYYADMGVTYLRVDFLSWFEDGKDKLPELSNEINRPKEHYRTALRWMKEACDANNIILSLVMPHLYNNAENEIIAAPNSLIRINEDVCDGGWFRLSEINRGQSHSIWSKYHNMFDGFVYWSRVSDKMILDGDFTRLNTFANYAEKKTAISLQIMAGGPIAVADQYSTIGDNLRYYTNNELLDLNKEKFIGQPLSNNPLDEKSQIWKGQTENGDWIVGLFNRNNYATVRSFNLYNELGINKANVRELWSKTDLADVTKLEESIEPHCCRIFRISNDNTTSIQKVLQSGIKLYPTLIKDYINIDICSPRNPFFSIYNTNGKLIYSSKLVDNSNQIDLKNGTNNGVYMVRIANGDNSETFKVNIHAD